MSNTTFSVDDEILVTVVTPVYNQASTLEETIESVLSQTYANIEYIIVNDGSTDNTQDILDSYSHTIKVISQENKGQSEALNRGWNESSGQYLTYLSADDVIYPDCIESLVSSIDRTAVVYYPDFDLIDVHSNKIRSAEVPDYNREDLLCGLVCQPGLAAIFCANAFRATCGWDTSYRFIPDFEFWTRMSSHGHFKHVRKPLGGFRIHETSGSVRDISVGASDEIVRFVDKFGYDNSNHKKRACFQSRLMSSRSHFQSHRIMKGVIRYFQAVCYNPIRAVMPANLKFVLSGLVRRIYYRLKARG